ncbi:MAG: glycoside hydrolase family 3 C-terminal domain-containing protein, partial [bacterium]
LLKNDGILPCVKNESILVLGDLAMSPRMNGGGSSELHPYRFEVPLEEIRRFVPAAYLPGYEVTKGILEAAAKAEKIILFTGTTAELESEGRDRPNMRLPEEQLAFLEAISRANPNIVVVNASGASIETGRILQAARGLIQAWFCGSASGRPIAEILFGAVNPSGRLSETFPIQLENTSSYPAFPAKGGSAVYQEGLFTGYRFFDTHQLPVAFPFGFGLSYTRFEHSHLTLSKTRIANGETLIVTVEVANVGDVAGRETVQLYVAPVAPRLPTPTKTLKAFAKVELAPGEHKTVTFRLSDADFATFFVEKNAFLVEAGAYGILIGASVADIRQEAEVFFASADETRPRLGLKHPASDWLAGEPEKSLLQGVLAKTRKLQWWEYENPVERILARICREGLLTKMEYEEFLAALTR